MSSLPSKLIITETPLETFRNEGGNGWCLLKFKIRKPYGLSTIFGIINGDTIYCFDDRGFPNRYEYDSWMGAMFGLAKGETLFLQSSLQNRIDGHNNETPYTSTKFAEAWSEIDLSGMTPHKRNFARNYPSLVLMEDFYEKNASPGKCTNWCGKDAMIPVTWNGMEVGNLCEQCRTKFM